MKRDEEWAPRWVRLVARVLQRRGYVILTLDAVHHLALTRREKVERAIQAGTYDDVVEQRFVQIAGVRP